MLATNYKIGFLIIQIISSIAEKSSTTTSYVNSDDIWRNSRSSRSKLYYYFAPRSYDNEPPDSNERGDYDTHYQGYQAQWPSVIQQPVHVHPVPYKEKDNKQDNYILPLLLLALLPLLLGAIILLPLVFTFFTNVLQLLALLQQNLINTNNGGGGTNVGRKRRNLQGVNPFLTTTVMSLIDSFSSALEKYGEKSN